MKKISMIFRSKTDSPDLTFVEVENEDGESFEFGKWEVFPDPTLAKLHIEIYTDEDIQEAIHADRERLLEALISTVANYEGLSSETRKQDIAKIQEIFDNTARR